MTVLRKDEDDWWYARHSDGRVGSIPVPYVEVVSEGGGAGGRLRPQWDPNVCVCLSEHVCVCGESDVLSVLVLCVWSDVLCAV